MKRRYVFVFLFLSSLLVSAQDYRLNEELNGGYAHISGDGGLNGFNVGAAIWLNHKLSIAYDYDSGWNNSRIGTFELTSVGLIVSKSQLQDLYLLGPRVFFPGLLKSKDKHISRLLPFAEAQFGISNLDSKLQEPTMGIFLHAADKEFSWMLGGGADYRFAPHWAARGKLDFLRTHFAETGQSRVRVGLGIVYTFKER